MVVRTFVTSLWLDGGNFDLSPQAISKKATSKDKFEEPAYVVWDSNRLVWCWHGDLAGRLLGVLTKEFWVTVGRDY